MSEHTHNTASVDAPSVAQNPSSDGPVTQTTHVDVAATPEATATPMSKFDQTLQTYFEEFEKTFNCDPQKYFHAMHLDNKWLSRANAWELACTLMADAYVCFTQRHNLVKRELLKAYVGLTTPKGVVNLLQLVRKVIELRNTYLGNSFLQSTINGFKFSVDCKEDGSDSDINLTKSEMYVKLDRAKFKELVKAFRLYVESACARMFPRNLDMKKWSLELATYKDYASGNQRTSLEFAKFAGELLSVHWKLFKFTGDLAEVDSAMVNMKAVLQKEHEKKNLNTYSKNSDKPSGYRVKKNPRVDTVETPTTETRKFRVVKPVGPPPRDAWTNGNPLVKNVVKVTPKTGDDTTADVEADVDAKSDVAVDVKADVEAKSDVAVEVEAKSDAVVEVDAKSDAEPEKTDENTSKHHSNKNPSGKYTGKGKDTRNERKKVNPNDGQWHTVRSKKNSQSTNDGQRHTTHSKKTSQNTNTRKFSAPLR